MSEGIKTPLDVSGEFAKDADGEFVINQDGEKLSTRWGVYWIHPDGWYRLHAPTEEKL